MLPTENPTPVKSINAKVGGFIRVNVLPSTRRRLLEMLEVMYENEGIVGIAKLIKDQFPNDKITDVILLSDTFRCIIDRRGIKPGVPVKPENGSDYNNIVSSGNEMLKIMKANNTAGHNIKETYEKNGKDDLAKLLKDRFPNAKETDMTSLLEGFDRFLRKIGDKAKVPVIPENGCDDNYLVSSNNDKTPAKQLVIYFIQLLAENNVNCDCQCKRS